MKALVTLTVMVQTESSEERKKKEGVVLCVLICEREEAETCLSCHVTRGEGRAWNLGKGVRRERVVVAIA